MRLFLCMIATSAVCALATFASATPAAGRTMTVDDLRNDIGVGAAQISPDGKQIVALTQRADLDKNRYVSQLVLIDVATGAQRPLTQGRDDVNSPAWSPSGDRIAFIAQQGSGDDAQDQIFVMSMAGGDPVAVTASKTGVQQFVWSPDGTKLAYVAVDEAPKKTGEAKFDNPFEVGDNDFLARNTPQPAHLWVVPAAGGDAKRLTSGSWSLPQGAFAAGIDWSADGKTIGFSKAPDAITSHWNEQRLQFVDAATGMVRDVSDRAFSSSPLFSPDGSKVAYGVATSNDDPYFGVDVAVRGVAAQAPADVVTRPLDRNVNAVAWMPDGRSVLVAGNDRTKGALWDQPLAGTPTRYDLGDVSYSGGGTVARNGAIAFVGESGTRPSEVYYLAPGATSAPKRLTDFNAAIAALDLGRVGPVEWQSSDGFTEDGVLTYPPGFDSAKKYPLVMLIHGGPVTTSTEEFDETLGLQQILAAKGWVVFEPNYRGSDNTGQRFLRAIIGHVASGPGRDELEGLGAVEKLGFVDEKRIGVSGWSGGGLATAWLIGHSHIWKAAVVGGAVTNWVDEYALADVDHGFTDTFFGGSPWDPKYTQAYKAESPITYARSVTTPTLVLSDTGDYRVPNPQAFEFYHALHDSGVEAKFYELPRYGHFPDDPAGQMQAFQLWTSWFEDHLK